jgi:hypothetical protein
VPDGDDDICADRGGARALVFAEDGEHVAGQHHREVRVRGGDQLGRPLLVDGVAVAVQQTYRQRIDAALA